jgi:tetratricopeptide (TPR) repeat protein
VQSYRASLGIQEKLLAAAPRDPELQAEIASSHEGLGDVRYSRGELRAGLDHYERALALRESAYRARPGNAAYGQALGLLYVKAGDVLGGEGFSNLGEIDRASASYGKARAVLEQVIASHPQDTGLKSEYATALTHGALLALSIGDAPGALRDMRHAVAIAQERLARDPDNHTTQSEVLIAKTYLRYALIDNGLISEAIEQSRSMLANEEKLVAADPKNTSYRRNLSVTHNVLGRDLLLSGNVAEAVEHHRQALAMGEEALGADPKSEENQSMSRIPHVISAGRRLQKANTLRHWEICGALSRSAKRPSRPIPQTRAHAKTWALIYQDIGKSLAQTNDPAGAMAAFAKAIPLLEELSRQSPTHAARKARVADAHLDAAASASSSHAPQAATTNIVATHASI